MKWSIHIYDPKTETTKTHVKDYPGTTATMADAPAVVAKASRDFKKHMKYILAVPHRTGHATKKSPSQLQREIDDVLAGAAPSSAFEGAKAEAALIENELDEATKVLRAFPRGAMGLPPESVRLSPEYRAAKARTDKAFARLRAFNTVFVKKFAKELRAERAERDRARQRR